MHTSLKPIEEYFGMGLYYVITLRIILFVFVPRNLILALKIKYHPPDILYDVSR